MAGGTCPKNFPKDFTIGDGGYKSATSQKTKNVHEKRRAKAYEGAV